VIVMKDSEVLETGSVDDVLTRARSDYTRRLIKAGYA
jgi:ABC-type microcin C transport system duplicated ATPase subunit YejF